VLGLLHESEECREMHDAGGVGIAEFDAALGAVGSYHGLLESSGGPVSPAEPSAGAKSQYQKHVRTAPA
jgi:hypothetical protein